MRFADSSLLSDVIERGLGSSTLDTKAYPPCHVPLAKYLSDSRSR